MKIQPVEHIATPAYPDTYAEESRRALAKAQPRRWIAAPLVVGALSSAVAVGLSGCGDSNAVLGNEIGPTDLVSLTQESTEVPATPIYLTDGEPTTTPTLFAPSTTAATAVTSKQNQTISKVVPLFEYGEGTGSFGCVSIAAPVFFSEDEAFAILASAFADAGITLEANSKSQKAALPITDRYNFSYEEKALKTKRGTLTPDGTVNGIPVEFVSIGDVNEWDRKDYTQWISVEGYTTKGAAQILAENNPGLVVFYDPAAKTNTQALWDLEYAEGESDEAYHARWSAAYEKARGEARAQSEQQLRQQAGAFVAWMNGEGD